MAKTLFLSALPVLLLLSLAEGLNVVPSTSQGNPAAGSPPMWPAPAAYTSGTTKLRVGPTISSTFNCVDQGANCPNVESLLTGAVNRKLTTNVFGQHTATTATGTTLQLSVTVESSTVYQPQVGMVESYTLNVMAGSSGPSAAIECQQIFGCYHGLETLSQLVAFNFTEQAYHIHNAPWTVTDEPRFPHRGLLIDTSRHWLPLDYIRRVIDSITYAKLNVIHWHIVDAESFPFDSPSYPMLGEKGAWSSQERYTPNDVAAMVKYASDRGVRMMVEFDTPGHTASMCKGAPEVCPDPLCPSTNVNNWALDITKNVTYEVAYAVLKDLSNLFPDQMMHLGGDEVVYYCWSVHPKIVQWLKDRDLSFAGGYEYWVKKVQTYARTQLQKAVVGWEEIWNHFGTQLDKSTIIQQWLPNSVTLPLNVTSHGYRLIWSDSSRWYLDQLNVNWTAMYTAEPCNGLPDSNCKLIIGGEGCMWGETVDASDGLQTIWPRQAAVAERLWSPRASTQDLTAAETRILAFRCLLNDRGIPAAPVLNSVARSAPPNPGSCFLQ